MTGRERLANRRGSTIVTFEHEGRRFRASGSRFADGRLAEIFLDTGKAGSTVQQYADDQAILTSLLLQWGVSVAVIRRSIDGPLARALDLLDEPEGQQHGKALR
jgi:hypothetical protein